MRTCAGTHAFAREAPPRHGRHDGHCGTALLEVGAQNLDWPNIGFEYRPTRSFCTRYRMVNGRRRPEPVG